MRIHSVVKAGEEYHLNRATTKQPCQMLRPIMQLTQRRNESDSEFEKRTTRAVRRQGIAHVVNLDGTN